VRPRGRSWRTSSAGAAGLALAFALALALGACSSDSKLDLGLSAPNLNLPAKDEPKQRVATAADLIGPDGRCAGEAVSVPQEAAPQALNFTAGPQAGPAAGTPPQPAPGAPAAPLRTGVGLGMTECDVVRALGHTDRIEVATNERGQRNVTLTYLQGERTGIYRVVAGRLVALERAGEPPAPPKAAKPKKAAKKQPPG
jgi:hypothetical protein